MGYKLVKFNVVPEGNEQIDVIVKVPKEPRSVIHGVVIDECNKPVKDAVVKLLKMSNCEPNHLDPITHTFTDDHGQFLFGPLSPHVKYVIKVWINHVKTREIVIKSEDCHEENICEHKEVCEHKNNTGWQEYPKQHREDSWEFSEDED